MIFRKIKKNKGIICGDNNTIVNYVGDNNSNVVQVNNTSIEDALRYELQIILKNGKVKKHKYRDIKDLRNCVKVAIEEKENKRIKDFYMYVDGKKINNNVDEEKEVSLGSMYIKRYRRF